MGRQHTTWISEENWQKLTNIPGNSTSSRIGYAIKHVDPDHQMWVNAKMRQLETARATLRKLAHCIHDIREHAKYDDEAAFNYLGDLIAQVEWLWEASA